MEVAVSMNFRQFLCLVASTVSSLTAASVFLTLEVLSLERLHLSAFANGAVTSLFFLVILALGVFAHKLVKCYGHRKIYLYSKIILSFSYLIILIDQSVWGWAIASICLGVGGALIWPLTESSIAELSPNESKGRYVGLYQTALSVAFICGPFLASAFLDHIPWLIIFCFVISLVSQLFVRQFPWHFSVESEDLKKMDSGVSKNLKRLLPVLLLCSFIGGFYESGLGGLSIIVGLRAGFSDHWATSIPGIIAFGAFLTQYPLGLLADRYKAQTILLVLLLLLILIIVPLPAVFEEKYILLPLAMMWGAFGGAMSTLAMIVTAQKVDKGLTMYFTGLMVAVSTIGCAVAPSISGYSFDVSQKWGVPVVFTTLLGGSLLYILYQMRRGRFS